MGLMAQAAKWAEGPKLVLALGLLFLGILGEFFYFGQQFGEFTAAREAEKLAASTALDAMQNSEEVWKENHIKRPHGDVERELIELNAWVAQGRRFTGKDGEHLRDVITVKVEQIVDRLAARLDAFGLILTSVDQRLGRIENSTARKPSATKQSLPLSWPRPSANAAGTGAK